MTRAKASFLALGLIVLLAAALPFGCDESDGFSEPASQEEALSELEADLKNNATASWKITYSVTISMSDDLPPELAGDKTIVWYADARDRQRFDFREPIDLGDERWEQVSIFTYGYLDHIIICSPDLPADWMDEGGERGGCCEGSSSCGDTAANILNAAGFPLGWQSEEEGDIDLSGIRVSGMATRSIVGETARCYRLESTPDSEAGESETGLVELCFASNGALLFQSAPGFFEGPIVHEAQVIGRLSDSDFDLPFPHYVVPDDQ